MERRYDQDEYAQFVANLPTEQPADEMLRAFGEVELETQGFGAVSVETTESPEAGREFRWDEPVDTQGMLSSFRPEVSRRERRATRMGKPLNMSESQT